jgi:phosphohistidine phosphatase
MRQLTLLLLRHAEAAAARHGQPDIERPLTDHGRTEALDAAECMAAAQLRIDTVLVSPALRTRETAIIVAAELDIAEELQFDPALYLGEPAELLSPLQRCPDSVQTVLMVGHNPGLSALAQQFMGGKQRIDMRPAGLCRIDFEHLAWRQVRQDVAVSFAVLRY